MVRAEVQADRLGRAVDAEATERFIYDLRAEISERVKQQHQITVVAGATVAVAAGVLGNVDPPAGVLFALCLLFYAFTFAFLNQDLLIIAAARFITASESSQASLQGAWEKHLREQNRNLETSTVSLSVRAPETWFPRARTSLRASSNYAVPAVGALGAAAGFAADVGFTAALAFLLVPAALLILLVAEIAQVVAGYQSLGND